jgi:LmbE family N-acetylglucosaminyl deacetylase
VSTVVFVHAHPDDEALLTGGTMARLAAEGHRVVLVSATAGEAGLAADAYRREGSLGTRRRQELDAAARALGCARVVMLGYADSGMAGHPTGAVHAFAAANVDEAAAGLADILTAEHADAVVGYDAAGGYGHPDHRQVHVVTRAAARLAGTPVLFEATVDRRALQRAVRLLALTPLRRRFPALRPSMYDGCFADPSEITHCVDVSAHLAAKRAALAAHVSQASADGEVRSLAGMLRLPAPLFRIAFGREWFVEVGRRAHGPRADDLLAAARS